MFKGIFIVLGIAVAVFGSIITTLGLTGGFAPDWNAGDAIVTDALILGILCIVMAVGFTLFGWVIGKEGWDAPSQES